MSEPSLFDEVDDRCRAMVPTGLCWRPIHVGVCGFRGPGGVPAGCAIGPSDKRTVPTASCCGSLIIKEYGGCYCGRST